MPAILASSRKHPKKIQQNIKTPARYCMECYEIELAFLSIRENSKCLRGAEDFWTIPHCTFLFDIIRKIGKKLKRELKMGFTIL